MSGARGRLCPSAEARAPEPPEITDGLEPRRRLRLLIAAPTYHPFYSGAAERFRRYAPGLRARGIGVTVLTGTPAGDRARVDSVPECWNGVPNGAFLPLEHVDGVPVHRIRLPDANGLRRARWFAKSLRQLCGDPGPPQVLQIFGTDPAAVPELWRVRRLGIPIVATRTMMPALPRNRLKRRVRRALIRLPSRVVTCNVVSSHAMLAAFLDIGIANRMEVIPHGVDLERFRPARDHSERLNVRNRLGIPDRALILLFVGSVKPRKGVHRLVQAWCRLSAQHQDLHLVLVGPRPEHASPGEEPYHRALTRLAEYAGAADRLHFTGLVSEVEQFMRAADLFVLPSSREGMPNVLGEAMATGLPVVTTRFSGLSREFGEAGIHYVLSEFEPDKLASEIATLLASPERRAEIGHRGRSWVERNLDIAGSVDRYAELYFRLAAEQNRVTSR